MYDYKALKRVIVTLGITFFVVLAILLFSCRPLGGFALISALFMVVIALYMMLIPNKLIKEMEELEGEIDKLKNKLK
ncbi:MAG: hypothetical protein IIV29_01875 [Tidjanibacter sp.]|jgi:preprotein translocase subunit SecF|nr:hypothetical protein [Tidjanibacter sp.]MBQ5669419.1 hypothetical protein [Tidjanibacter sp.]